MEIKELYEIFKKHPVVTTDSRNCPEGSIFFALKGVSFDGNKFAASALDKGCAYAVVDEKEYATDTRCILVDDCLETLRQLAHLHRFTLGTRIIGITGTNGKTTTKELVSAVLAKKYDVLHTEGNFNNDIGVPKTLLRLTAKHEIGVIEMGASHPGDIRHLVEIVEPDYGIITNVGRAHLKGFGSFEGVIKTKGELYDYLRTKKDSTVFINGEDNRLLGIAHGLKLVRYGLTEADNLYVSGRMGECSPYLSFKWRHGDGQWHKVETHLIGAYNVYNMLAAVCIGLYFEVAPQLIDEALSSYVPSNDRSELEETKHNHLIVDAYNANPTSMNAAIENFRRMDVENKMLILGDMNELGSYSGEEHQKLVDSLMNWGFTDVWLVGPEFAKTDCSFRKFDNVEDVKTAIEKNRPEHRFILIKGSNSIRLFTLPQLL